MSTLHPPAGGAARRAAAALLAVTVAGALGACGDASPARAGGWQASVDTIGDTIVVRTISGSDWGTRLLVPELRIGAVEGEDHEMFGQITGLAVDAEGGVVAYDAQVPALRRYDAQGRYLGTLGRRGEGPGEYRQSDGGIAVLDDGRIVLRDPGNARFSVWSADGSFLTSWPTRGGSFTSVPLFTDTRGHFYGTVFEHDRETGRTRTQLVRYDAGGAPLDSLALPTADFQGAFVRAQTENMSQSWLVPFAPSAYWDLHPDGWFVSGVADRYAIELRRPDGRVLRIERAAEPVAVSSEERRNEEERVTIAMRNVDPAWRWNGPPIPATKPHFRGLFSGRDGSIWVLLSQPGERIPDDELQPDRPGQPPQRRFREPVVFDVFDSDGRYRGQVRAPTGFQTGPRPIFERDRVTAVERDELGVAYIVRYRLADG